MIVRVLLSSPGRSADDQVGRLYPEAQLEACAAIDAVAVAMQAFLAGEPMVFSPGVLTLNMCTAFQALGLRAVQEIPRGSVMTYKSLSAQLGQQNGARAMGNALAHNPFPLLIPCHRVLCSDLHLGGYQGGQEMKRALLLMEGINFNKSARAICAPLHRLRLK